MSSAKESPTGTVAGVQLQVANDFSATPQAVTDPTGTASPLQVSTGAVIVGNNGKFGIGLTPSFPMHVAIGDSVRFELGGTTAQNAMVSLGAPGLFNIDKVDV